MKKEEILDIEEQKKLKKESLKKFKEILLALDKWKKDSLASQNFY